MNSHSCYCVRWKEASCKTATRIKFPGIQGGNRIKKTRRNRPNCSKLLPCMIDFVVAGHYPPFAVLNMLSTRKANLISINGKGWLLFHLLKMHSSISPSHSGKVAPPILGVARASWIFDFQEHEMPSQSDTMGDSNLDGCLGNSASRL